MMAGDTLRSWMVTLVVVASASCAAWGAPASLPATAAADELAPIIDEIRSAATVEQASTAYAKGCSISRQNPALNDAYMRRMLQMDKPDIAKHPAAILTKSDPNNATAWAVVCYYYGVRNNYASALKSILPGAAKVKNNNAGVVMLGQLVAWYEQQNIQPKLTPAESRGLWQAREMLENNPAYTKAYQRVKDAYESRARDLAGIEDKLRLAQNKVKSIEASRQTAQKQLDDSEEEMKDLRKSIATLQYRVDNESNSRVRATIQDSIAQKERQYDRSKRSHAKLKQQLADLQTAAREARQDVDQANRKSASPVLVKKLMEWPLPVVAKGRPTASRPTTTRPIAHSRPTVGGDDREADAAQQLKLAQTYLNAGMKKQAREMLDKIVTRYPKTKAGKQASEMLKKLDAQ